MPRVGAFEGIFVLLNFAVMALPIIGLWLLWRGVRALESVAAALRDRS